MIRSWKKNNSTPSLTKEEVSVTVVVALRNEEKNIQNLLSSLYSQTYKNINFIFVNDHSDDNTLSSLKSNIQANTQVLTLNKNENGKKTALRKGIETTTSELIITTDADCVHSNEWVTTIVNHYIFHNKPLLLSAPVKFSPTATLFQKIEAIEFGSLILTGACSIFLKKPNMCNGANLSFQREAFLKQNNYALHAHLPTGDDEFFLHQIASKDPNKIVFIKDQKAIASTPPPKDIFFFIQQRIRWASKWKHYHNKGPQWNAIFIFSLHFSFLLSIGQILFISNDYKIFSIALFLRIIGEYLFNSVILKWQRNEKLIKLTPIVSLFYPFYAFSIGILATFTKYSWKNRKYNV